MDIPFSAKLVSENGGRYANAMYKNECTHLILGTPGGKKGLTYPTFVLLEFLYYLKSHNLTHA